MFSRRPRYIALLSVRSSTKDSSCNVIKETLFTVFFVVVTIFGSVALAAAATKVSACVGNTVVAESILGGKKEVVVVLWSE